ncbi:hypothetical protein HK101_001100 [Irineochytrium annulatum]|nr:hypothetical protein HK101_001100 [Irineochytrium annulatum]
MSQPDPGLHGQNTSASAISTSPDGFQQPLDATVAQSQSQSQSQDLKYDPIARPELPPPPAMAAAATAVPVHQHSFFSSIDSFHRGDDDGTATGSSLWSQPPSVNAIFDAYQQSQSQGSSASASPYQPGGPLLTIDVGASIGSRRGYDSAFNSFHADDYEETNKRQRVDISTPTASLCQFSPSTLTARLNSNSSSPSSAITRLTASPPSIFVNATASSLLSNNSVAPVMSTTPNPQPLMSFLLQNNATHEYQSLQPLQQNYQPAYQSVYSSVYQTSHYNPIRQQYNPALPTPPALDASLRSLHQPQQLSFPQYTPFVTRGSIATPSPLTVATTSDASAPIPHLAAVPHHYHNQTPTAPSSPSSSSFPPPSTAQSATTLAGSPPISPPGPATAPRDSKGRKGSDSDAQGERGVMAVADVTPRKQKVRFDGDLYTPTWVRFEGQRKEGFCDLCPKPGRWLQLKNSAFW